MSNSNYCHECNKAVTETEHKVDKNDGTTIYFCDEVCENHYRLNFSEFKKWLYKTIANNFRIKDIT